MSKSEGYNAVITYKATKLYNLHSFNYIWQFLVNLQFWDMKITNLTIDFSKDTKKEKIKKLS